MVLICWEKSNFLPLVPRRSASSDFTNSRHRKKGFSAAARRKSISTSNSAKMHERERTSWLHARTCCRRTGLRLRPPARRSAASRRPGGVQRAGSGEKSHLGRHQQTTHCSRHKLDRTRRPLSGRARSKITPDFGRSSRGKGSGGEEAPPLVPPSARSAAAPGRWASRRSHRLHYILDDDGLALRVGPVRWDAVAAARLTHLCTGRRDNWASARSCHESFFRDTFPPGPWPAFFIPAHSPDE